MDWLLRWACIFCSGIQGELKDIAAAFMEMIHPMVTSRDKDYIINMDQLAITFTFNRHRTLELIGTHCPYPQINIKQW